MAQPAYVLEAFALCTEFKNKIEQERHKQAEREREKWQRRQQRSAKSGLR